MGSRVNILVQPTRDLEKIMSSIQGARVDNDSMQFLDALESADHFFENKMLDKRLVVFAGGPIFWFKYHIKELATKLKVKGVAVDVVNFGDKLGPQVGVRMGPWDPSWNDNNIKGESKKENIEALVATANNYDNSRILQCRNETVGGV
ncbi:26S proteasome non-ATPase regulatory subunit 4 [Tanacetum coccineum]